MSSLIKFAAWLAVTWFVIDAGPMAAAPPAHPATAAATGDVVLLNFSASWCGPCRQMAPLINQVAAAGWLVRQVDVDRETDLVRRFAVSGVPCYVLLVKGHEVGRIDGATTQSELERLLAKSGAPLGGQGISQPQALPVAAAGIPLPATPAAGPLVTEAVIPAAFPPPPAVLELAASPFPAPLPQSFDREAAVGPSPTLTEAQGPASVPGREPLRPHEFTECRPRGLPIAADRAAAEDRPPDAAAKRVAEIG